MGFSDVIKKSVLEKFQASNISTMVVAMTLGTAIVLGLFIYFVYRFNSKSGFYNRNFNKALATLPLITAAIMLAMGSNLTIGLGMVGALSIVRFRNAVKDPADLTYLFWSISAGIIVGANMIELAAILSLAMAVILYGLDLLPALRSPCILVVSAGDISAEADIAAQIKENCRHYKVRSRNISKRGVEWIFELQLRRENELADSLSRLPAVSSVHLMTHDGELRF